MKEKRLNEVKGVILIAVGLLVLASLIRFDRLDLPFYSSQPNIPPQNLLGIFGAYLGAFLVILFGLPTSFAIPALIILLGIKFFRQESPRLSIARIFLMLVLLFSLSSLIGMFYPDNAYIRFNNAGLVGGATSGIVTAYLSRLGGFIIFATLIILSFAVVSESLISSLFINAVIKLKALLGLFFKFRNKRPLTVKVKPSVFLKPQVKEREERRGLLSEPKAKAEPAQSAFVLKPKIQIKAKPAEEPSAKIKPKEVQVGDYHLPGIDLLDSPPSIEARQIKENLESNARLLEETLEDFGISVKVTDIERGPVITRYELEPAPGVKVNRIVALSDDIALTMKASSVRIVAPIPGKSRVGIEVPNTQSSLVYLKEIFSSNEFQGAQSKLPLALGKDIAGQPVVTDLGGMPHLLIAGTTGSGKTVCVNSLILSLLFRLAPNELKFLMVDPKMVEMAPFNGLPHLLCPVVTDAKKAAVALNWAVTEMEERYKLLAKAGARNVESYNLKQEKIPYIVVIIDELADLMTVSRDHIEGAITRLAQLSRAVGIHLILATQRPSVDVITGVIKANFPARISFKVASKVDSRTVLDTNGADKLLGKGDMLFMRPGEEKLIRAQGTLISDKEIEKVVDFIKAQAEPVYDDEILKEQHKSLSESAAKDELYEEAVRVIMESNQASVTILQRRMRLGYTRAARIIDTMEQEGLIGPFEGSKPRRILADRQEWLQKGIAEEDSDGIARG